ncbi:MAG: single-stranded DNA-binding protein [Methylobacter sp.]
MLNKVILIGNLGADPEIRFLPSGNKIASFSLATSRRWKDKQSGERREETEWHRITIFGTLADIVEQYVKKGSKVYLEGRIKTTKWNKDGVDQYSTGIIAETMLMLDGRPSSGNQSAPSPAQNNFYQGPSERDQPNYSNGGPNDFDDDIPFDSLNWQIKAHLI